MNQILFTIVYDYSLLCCYFFALLFVIRIELIASATREKLFGAHLISDETEIIFLDEWTSDSLNAEDAKKVLQGGLQILPQKDRDAARLYYKSGILITTNDLPNFGEGPDDRAIASRLDVFHMRPLPKVRKSVTAWLRKNCMSVFHYCAEKLKDEPLFSEGENTDSEGDEVSDEGAKYNDYDHTNADDLLDLKEIANFQFSQEQFTTMLKDAQETVTLDLFPKEMLDKTFLERDIAEQDRWQRYHTFFIYDGEINCEKYHEAVMCLARGYWKNAKIDYTASDERRFDIIFRNGWTGVDSLYDAWLIMENKRREEFDYQLFLQRYNGWEEFQTKRKERSKEKNNQTHNTREGTVSENYSKENDGDENIPKEQSKPKTYSIREIVPREEVSDDSKVTQEEQCQQNTPIIQEIVPLGEIRDDSKEHGKENVSQRYKILKKGLIWALHKK